MAGIRSASLGIGFALALASFDGRHRSFDRIDCAPTQSRGVRSELARYHDPSFSAREIAVPAARCTDALLLDGKEAFFLTAEIVKYVVDLHECDGFGTSGD